MNNLDIKIIVASDKAWGIGKNGDLLTHIPSDLRYFRDKTLGGLIVMGRKTANSFPEGKALPNRINVMLSKTEDVREGYIIVKNVDELFELLKTSSYCGLPLSFDSDRIYIAGGGEIYQLLLPYVNRILITKMDTVFDADTFFVDLDADEEFVMIKESESIIENGISFRYCEYQRK